MYMHRSGFHPPNETVSSHARKRYRLTPGRNQSVGTQPQCDPALWLVHYVKAERRDHIPTSQIPIPPQIQHSLRERAFLQRQGQLPRKEFMLTDSKNWPTINIPGLPNAAPAAAQGGLGRGGPVGPAPPGARGRGRGPSISMVEATVEEEEDVSRGDALDFLTPREISKMRYEQHHEWMDQVVGSTYNIHQIVPVELGLGRKGALEELTNGFFTAPTSIAIEPSADGAPPRVGRLEGDKAAQFRQHAEVKLAKMQAELEKMARDHSHRMAQLQKSSQYATAERKLRYAVDDTNSSISESLRLERTRAGQDVPAGERPKVAEIIAEVESATNKLAISVKDVDCVERGGLEEKPEEPEPIVAPAPAPAPSPKPAVPAADVPIGNTMLEQPVQSRQPSPLPPTRGIQSQSISPLPNVPTTGPPASETVVPPTTHPSVPPPTNVQNNDVNQPGDSDPTGNTGMDVDIDMSGLDNPNPESAGDAQVDDWVMVNEDTPTGAEQPQAAPTIPAEATSAAEQSQPQGFSSTSTALPSAPATSTSTHATPSAAPAEETEPTPLDTTDFSAFENINTAGEAMEGFDTGTDLHSTHDDLGGAGGDLGVGDAGEIDFGDLGDHDMVGGGDDVMDDLGGAEDSAFGEAFHGTDLGERD